MLIKAGPAETGMAVLGRGLEILKSALPEGWEIVGPSAEPKLVGSRADAMITLRAMQNYSPRIIVEAYRDFTPREVDRVFGGRADTMREASGGAAFLVIAPSLSERARSFLAKARINYLDLAGNVRIELTIPGLFIEKQAPTKSVRMRQSKLNLRGPKASRLVRLLLDVAPPYGVTDLARSARLNPGYVSRLLEYLEAQAILDRSSRGVVKTVEWQELLRVRSANYDLFKTNSASSFVAPAGPAAILERLRDAADPAVILTGSFAIQEFVRIAPPSLLTVYLENELSEPLKSASLLPADQGANVVILRPYDPSVVERPRRAQLQTWLPLRVKTVAASQLALDSLSGSGRMPSEGEALIEWMAQNEALWRYESLSKKRPWD